MSSFDQPKPVVKEFHDPLACEWDLALHWNFTSDGPLNVPAGIDDEDAGVKIGRHEILIRPNPSPDPRQLVVSQSLLRLLQENERLRLLAQEDGRLSPFNPRRVIVITPTYKRTFQQLLMLGLINSLKRVQAPVLWVVIEATKTEETARLIAKATIGDSGSDNPEVEIAHLGVEEEMPEDWDERILLEQRMRVVGLRGWVCVGWVCAESGWVCAESGWVCAESGWVWAEGGWVCAERGWVCRERGWVYAESGWVCAESGWVWAERGWVCAERGWVCAERGWVCAESGWVCRHLLDGIVVFADDGSVFSPKFLAEAQRVPWFGAGSVGVLLPVGFTPLFGSEEAAEEQSSQAEGLGGSRGKSKRRGHGHGRRIASTDSNEGDSSDGAGGGESGISGGNGGVRIAEAAAAAGIELAVGGEGSEKGRNDQETVAVQEAVVLDGSAKSGINEGGGAGGGERGGEMGGGKQGVQQGEEKKQEGQGEWQTQQQKLQQTQGKQGEGGNGVGDVDEQSKMRLPQRRLLQASSQSASSNTLRVGKQTRYQMPVQGPVCNNEKEELPDWVRGWDEWGPELERGLGGGSEESSEAGSEEDPEGGSVAGSGAEGRLFDLLGAVVRNEKELRLIGQCGRRVLVWWWRAEARQDSKFPAE
ncbi:unnamed protein product [Closterium sp. NIES-65]|nr:unnamed protein product [Closterium sp. NIES-65]CAI6000355.1 unnamed protein product [Closterium sp. NIES-65]